MLGGYEPIRDESTPSLRAGYWQAGIGLQRVDGLSVSDDLRNLAAANIKGLVGYDAIEQAVIDKYKDLDLGNVGIMGGFEADLVATRISRLLSENDFILSVATLKSIHRELFRGLEPFDRNLAPGVFKTQNWRKSERILYGESVRYGRADTVEENLQEAVEGERDSTYPFPPDPDALRRLAAFCSRLWQIHPFSEGNTRTVAVYMEKYLRSMGFSVDNSPFEEHSAYFRDALVRSCFMDASNGIQREPAFLERFFENLLVGAKHELTPKDLYVEALNPNRRG
jgi:fido (protein-threonine AMPylation protein)